MSRIIPAFALLIATLLLISCGEPAANNAANKPANAANNAAANTASSSASADADIKKLMGEIAAALAKNDADAVSKFYADDYHLVTPQGVDQNKTDRIADMRSGATKFDSFAYENINVRTFGDTAVAIATVKAKGVVSNQPRTSDMIATLVFRKMGDGWKVVSGQATPVTAAAAKPDEKAPANTANANTNAAKPPPPAVNKPAANKPAANK